MNHNDTRYAKINNIKTNLIPAQNLFIVKYKGQTLSLKNVDLKNTGLFAIQYDAGTSSLQPRPIRIIAKDEKEALMKAIQITQIPDIKYLSVSRSKRAYECVCIPGVFINGPKKGLITKVMIGKSQLIEKIAAYSDFTLENIITMVLKCN